MSADRNRVSERIASSKMGVVRQDDNRRLVMFGKDRNIAMRSLSKSGISKSANELM